MIKLTVKSNKAFYKNVAKNLEKQVEGLIDTTVTDIVTEASSRVPVDTGFLRSKIDGQAKDMVGIVQVKATYAPYIEFGTGGLVDVPSGLEDYAIKFKGAGVKQVNITPKPFLYPAFKNNTKKMLETLQKLELNGGK